MWCSDIHLTIALSSKILSFCGGTTDSLTHIEDSELELVVVGLCFTHCWMHFQSDVDKMKGQIRRKRTVTSTVWMMQLASSCELGDHSVVTFRPLTKTSTHPALMGSLVDNNTPLQLATCPLTATCAAKHHKVNNFLIAPWLRSWAPVSHREPRSGNKVLF